MRDIIIPIGGTRPPEPDNQCSLCKRTVPPSQLTRCPRCKQLFCRSCITEDLRDGEYLVCLNCARRYVAPTPAFKGKYTPLTLYLSNKAKWTTWVKLHFSQIEGIIGKELPASAHKSPEWWTKENSVRAQAWQSIGWNIKEANIEEKTVIFTRPNIVKPEKKNKPKKTSPLVSLPEYKPRKMKTPSLTRIAIAQARLENVSRRKSSMRKYRGKFRPKTAYEKRLWKTDEKP
ncbi:MAG TPA: hypothetical protein ENN36_00260 [Candidatus Bathyarchaeota archaeon]|nr:hypothetical protein [Candidatus Bathyarchaeota archaeon]